MLILHHDLLRVYPVFVQSFLLIQRLQDKDEGKNRMPLVTNEPRRTSDLDRAKD